MPMVEVSNGGTPSISPDSSRLLGSITGANQTFKAPEDCIMVGRIHTPADRYYRTEVYVNGSRIWYVSNGNSYNPNDVQSTVGEGSPVYGFFIPEGSVVSTPTTSYVGGTYDLKFYGIA